ncbi:trypsin CFT-1-like [Pectinophora gossypiella]|nr:trypsin CFT-1-like [Pectinophora gossypiella]
MRAGLVLLLGVAAVAAFPHDPNRIVGGSVTTVNQYPFAVALLASWSGAGVFGQSCGGTIINNRSVLSAAHCFVMLSLPIQWRSRIGSSFASSGGSVFTTAQIIRHPSYNSAIQDNDIAILRVSGTIAWVPTVVAPASIAGANYNLGDNQVVWAIGWGRTSTGGATSEQLRHVQIWTVNQAVCVQRYRQLGLQVTDNMVCAGWLDVGQRDQCQGDSGGPLLHNNVVVGVCSWGDECAHPYYPGVNARVSRSSAWIVANS